MPTVGEDGVREDVTIYPVTTALLGRLQTEFEGAGLGTPDFLTVMPGQDVSIYIGFDEKADDSPGGCLQVWVRLSSAFISVNFPQQDTTHPNSIKPAAFELEIGAVRCTSVGNEDGEGASQEDLLAASRLQMADMAAMKRAICGCLKDLDRTYLLEDYAPQGPLGGIVGGSWGVMVEYKPMR